MNIIQKFSLKGLLAIAIFSLAISSCKKEKDAQNPVVEKIEPGSASGGDVLTLTGSGLAGMESIIFELGNVPAIFNPVFNTENAILFRVPDTAYGGQQNITLTNSQGRQVQVPINVIALPTISGIFPTDFTEGTEITISGNNLETVSEVTIAGTNTPVAIISTSRKTLVVSMPAVTAAKVKLSIENESGTRDPDISLVNLGAAFSIFTEGAWAMDNWSWGGNYQNSTDFSVTGSEGLKANMAGNSWGALSLHANNAIDLAPYREIAFWIKGAETELTFALMLNWANSVDVVVPPQKWTYYSFPLQPWKSAGVNSLSDLIYQVKGDGALVYFDNIVLLK